MIFPKIVVAIQLPTSEEFWITNYNDFTHSLRLPIKSDVITIKIPEKKFLYRITHYNKSERIEPIYIRLKPNLKFASKLAQKIAKEDHYYEVYRIFKEHIESNKHKKKKSLKIRVNQDLFKFLHKNSLRDTYSTQHIKLKLLSQELREDKETLHNLLQQLEPFFKDDEIQNISKIISSKKFIDVESTLLPFFGKKMIRKFLIYRGPNCFHAALSFHSKLLTNSNYFNVTREKGYHPAMVNYDELWRTLNSNFYQVNNTLDSLKYGDILVFFDVPKKRESFVNFRWIKHTAAYLFNGYTFSKGSKSANSPYTIKTLKNEWMTWSKISKNLGVKVFRRGTKNVKKRPPKDLTDWIY